MINYIKLLKSSSFPVNSIYFCWGGGAATENFWENREFAAGEILENNEEEIDISLLDEGIDYLFINL